MEHYESGDAGMSKLITEYTDTKDVKHQVEHTTVAEDNQKNREQLLDELVNALDKKDKRISA